MEVHGEYICFTCRIIGVYLGLGSLKGARLGQNGIAPNGPVSVEMSSLMEPPE
jgi:hypothetical protein